MSRSRLGITGTLAMRPPPRVATAVRSPAGGSAAGRRARALSWGGRRRRRGRPVARDGTPCRQARHQRRRSPWLTILSLPKNLRLYNRHRTAGWTTSTKEFASVQPPPDGRWTTSTGRRHPSARPADPAELVHEKRHTDGHERFTDRVPRLCVPQHRDTHRDQRRAQHKHREVTTRLIADGDESHLGPPTTGL